MFLGSRNSTKLFSILWNASGSQKFKMAAHKHEYFLLRIRHLRLLIAACITQYWKYLQWIHQPLKHGSCRWNFSAMLYTCWDISISSLITAILDFWLPLAPYNIENSFIEFLDLENMGKVVGIMQLACIQSELLFFLKFFNKLLPFAAAILDFWVTIEMQ